MKTEIVKLPDEVNEIALKVSEEKQEEVKTVLNQIFTGTSDWEKKVDAIKIKDINDTMSIQMADVARKNVKTARLQAEKVFNIKRSEVQERMSEDKLEDQLWLKAKQIMQLKFKHIEEKAKIKAEFVQRYETEQLKLRNDLRYEKVLKFTDPENIAEISNELGSMPENIWKVFISGLETQFNERIEAEAKAEKEKIENARIEKLHNKRKELILPYWSFIPQSNKNDDFGLLTDKEWNERFEWTKSEKEKYEKEQEKIRKENEQLRKEAEKKRIEQEKITARNKKRNDELRSYIVFIRDYNKMLNMEEKEYQKEFSDIKKGAEDQWEYDRKEMQKKAAQEEKDRTEKDELKAKLIAKEKAEQKAKQKILDIQQAEFKAAKDAKLAPDKEKLIELSKTIQNLKFPQVKSIGAINILENVQVLLTKTSNYINEKSSEL